MGGFQCITDHWAVAQIFTTRTTTHHLLALVTA